MGDHRERVLSGLTLGLEVYKSPYHPHPRTLLPTLGAETLILQVFEGKPGAGKEPRMLEELRAQL